MLTNARLAGTLNQSSFRQLFKDPLLVDYLGYWKPPDRDHLNLIFLVYLKLMTGFPSFQAEEVGAELLH